MTVVPGLILCLLLPAADKPPALPATWDPVAIDQYIAGQVKSKNLIGVSVALVRNGQVELAKGYGSTALKDGVPVTADTPFAIGSVSKQFTCAAILLLAQDGKLSIDDPVAKYFPKLTKADKIRIQDLMGHTSGYPDYYPLDFLDRRMKNAIALDDLIHQYAGGKLDFEPGEKYSYSNTGFIILGRIVEKVSGVSLGEFLEQRVFKPLGMTNTKLDPDPKTPGLSTGHTAHLLGDGEAAIPEGKGWLHGAGGIYSTANDLAKWDIGLLSGKVVNDANLKQLETPRKLNDGKRRYYSYGLSITERDGETILAHGGAVSGFHSYNAMIRRNKSAVILLANAEHIDSAGMHRDILNLMIKDPNAIPKVSGLAAVDEAKALIAQLQKGELSRDRLAEEFSHYMSEERVAKAKEILGGLGAPVRVDLEGMSERGGMEVAAFRITFKGRVVKASLYRKPDGTIEQFLLSNP